MKFKVGDICDINKTSLKKNHNLDFINYLDTGNITEGRVDEIKKIVFSDEKAPSRAKRVVKENDIIISTVRPNQKHYGIIKNPIENLIVSTGFTVLSPKKGINADYLYNYLTLSNITEYLQGIAETSTTTYPSITPSVIESLEIEIPSEEEQKAIANILSSLDDKIELNNQMNETLEEMAQTLFKRWFVDFEFPNEDGQPYKSSGGEMIQSELGMIPKGWKVKSLENLAILTMGVSPTSDSYNEEGEGMPLINGAADFKGKNIIPIKYTTAPKKLCEDGDMVFGVRATIGNTVFADKAYAIGRGVAAVKAIDEQDKEFIYYHLEHAMDKLINSASGSVFLNLKKSDILGVKFAYNKGIVTLLHQNLFNIVSKIIENDKQNRILESSRDTLLPKLMSGEIRVSDLEE